MSDDALDSRAEALEGGPCGQSGAVARVGSLLSHPAMWDAPPELPGGIAALIARAEAASDSDEAPDSPVPLTSTAPSSSAPSSSAPSPTAPSSSAPPSSRPTDGRPGRGPSGDRTRPGAGRRRPRRWVIATAVALVLVAAGIGGVLSATQERPSATIELAGGGTTPLAHGEIQIIERDAGWRLVLDATGLPSAAAGTYYQGWAVRDGEYVPLGTFHMHKEGRVELWSGVPLRMFRRIEITLQKVGAGQQPGTPLLSGTLSG
ncbi:anti-sigma factor [Actinoplanes sp. NBRC 103695]|uniref:anti-sigma factor n=1 Tax=Actinoplanes sp. NBRC 103695 TaxID=3032202 RepID=UPI0024A115ED|nr:anti-sigma factor [Actinoplanes sp. NBRC 103695]GLY99158.1 hypothetical protein Acsp02_64120 [Actinoplanes sp. NBRC 103695]